ncbi:MAG: radical SAM protein [Lachnospiraceae bacterium]|nr:radical SAM protein [Lachnospiraceae bacterium]
MKYNLRMCVWEITLACCFSCKYCGSGGGKARENELITEECLDVADQLKDLGCRRVSMIGGEVFMRRDWKQIVKRLTDHGIRVNIITNGYLFKNDLIQDLKEVSIESVSVSLDGPKAFHDKYRQEGSFDRAVSAMEALLSAGIPVSVISTLNSENAKHLEEMFSFLRKYTIYAWQLQACSPMGNAANMNVDYRFDMGAVMNFVAAHMHEAPFAMGVADNIGYFTEHEGSVRGNMSGKAIFRGCSAGIASVGIDSVGNVRGCESMYDPVFTEGNLRKESLRTIWDDPKRFAYNRKFNKDMLTGKCAECELGEYCAGGCRSYNYFVHRKIYESPFCAKAGRE